MLDLIETILTYKFAKLSYQELTAMFGLSELRQTRIFQEALQEGREVSKAEGVEVGAIQAKLAIAKNLLNLGVLIEQVSVATGLSLAEIEKLQS
jgi:predicted transposase/invertase (TIGR01784 family)